MHSKDNPPPLPFAELLKLANIKPPFSVEYDNDTGPEDGGFWEWYTVDRYRCDSKEEAELLQRLLSWAHAGGVDRFKELLPIESGDLAYVLDAQLLALLDGQKNL